MSNIKDDVAGFWNGAPCDGGFGQERERAIFRYTKEPFLRELLTKERFHRKRVLEVGCGQGTDLQIICGLGARATGIDISFHSLRSILRSPKTGDGKPPELVQSDAEKLCFRDQSWDLVYSMGVLHHTPDTARAIDEIHRVLGEDGEAVVMLYRKFSPKQVCVSLVRTLSRLVDLVTGKSSCIYDGLRRRFPGEIEGWGTAFHELLGVPIIKSYTRRNLKQFFAGFSACRIRACSCGFTQIAAATPFWPILIPVANALDRLENLLGFYWIVEATK